MTGADFVVELTEEINGVAVTLRVRVSPEGLRRCFSRAPMPIEDLQRGDLAEQLAKDLQTQMPLALQPALDRVRGSLAASTCRLLEEFVELQDYIRKGRKRPRRSRPRKSA